MSAFIEATERKTIELATTWRAADVSERQELQNMVFPQGLPYSVKNGFFEPAKSSLITDLVDVLESLCTVGVPDGI